MVGTKKGLSKPQNVVQGMSWAKARTVGHFGSENAWKWLDLSCRVRRNPLPCVSSVLKIPTVAGRLVGRVWAPMREAGEKLWAWCPLLQVTLR